MELLMYDDKQEECKTSKPSKLNWKYPTLKPRINMIHYKQLDLIQSVYQN